MCDFAVAKERGSRLHAGTKIQPRIQFMRFVFSTAEVKRYRFPTHINDLVVDRADAQTSEVFVVVLEPGEAPPRVVGGQLAL